MLWKHYQPAVIHCLLTKVINGNNHTTILYLTIYRYYIQPSMRSPDLERVVVQGVSRHTI